MPHRNLARNTKPAVQRRKVEPTATEVQRQTLETQAAQRAASTPPANLRPSDVLALQRRVGNRAVQRRLNPSLTPTHPQPLPNTEAAPAEATPAPTPITEVQPSATLQRQPITPASPRIQRAGGLGRFARGQMQGYQEDMGAYGGMLQTGFVDAPMAAYNTFAPSEEDKKKKGFGQSLKRGAQYAMGGLAAGVTGLVTGGLSLGLGALGATASTLGRGAAVAGRGIWSGLKGMWNGLKAAKNKIGDRFDLWRGKKGTGFEAQRNTSATDTSITSGSIINAAVNQGVSLAEGAGATATSVTAAVTGPVAGLIGIIKGAVSAARAHRARKRQNQAESTGDQFEQTRTELAQQQLQEWLAQTDNPSPEAQEEQKKALKQDGDKFLAAVRFLAGKNKLKKWRSIMESTAAFAGAGGSIALSAGMIAGAVGLTALLASNPVGWGIALGIMGIGTLTAIGYGLYKLINAAVKGSQKGVERKLHAENLFDLVNKGFPPAIQFLQEIGVLKATDEGKGKFTLEQFKQDKTQSVAHLMSKMRST